MTTEVLTGARVATMQPPGAALGGAKYGLVERGAVAMAGGRILWAGPEDALPGEHRGAETTDLGGRLVTPALVDCHTHLVHGGHRAAEFEMRLEGASYEEIARAGGGILSTVEATRAASEDDLVASARVRLEALRAGGVATVEIKSGYGLDRETELRMLRAARRLGREAGLRVVTSFLGAHAVPPDYRPHADAYIDEVCIPALHAAHAEGLVDAVDGFCERIAFTPTQIGRVFDAAALLGLPVKLHAEQLSSMGGATLAAAREALSADHLEYLHEPGVMAMARAGTVAVLLPGAFYTLRETQAPPVEALREAGVPMAVASDMNPGSSPMPSVLMAMNMACTVFRLTPEEALAGATRTAARALGLGDEAGQIAEGMAADIAVWDVETPAELAYRVGWAPLHALYVAGARC